MLEYQSTLKSNLVALSISSEIDLSTSADSIKSGSSGERPITGPTFVF